MKKLASALSVLFVFALLAAPATAGVPTVSHGAINQMGLAGTTEMDDEDGDDVRGKGVRLRIRQTNVNISNRSFVIQKNRVRVRL